MRPSDVSHPKVLTLLPHSIELPQVPFTGFWKFTSYSFLVVIYPLSKHQMNACSRVKSVTSTETARKELPRNAVRSTKCAGLRFPSATSLLRGSVIFGTE